MNAKTHKRVILAVELAVVAVLVVAWINFG